MANIKRVGLLIILFALGFVIDARGQDLTITAKCSNGYSIVTIVLTDTIQVSCATPTPPPATATSVPTIPDTPTTTPPPVITEIGRENWPLCPTHDITKWHALDDPARQCHYTHTHGDDPNRPDVVEVFGPHTGDISYPWATTNENLLKHEGYFFLAYGHNQIPFSPHLNWLGGTTPNFIAAARIEMHFMPDHHDGLVRNHSYYMEVEVCSVADPSNCGIVRTGGHWSTGLLHCPYKNQYCALPNDPSYPGYWLPGQDTSGKTVDPYRAHLQNCPQLIAKLNSYKPAWGMNQLYVRDDINLNNTVYWTSAPGINGINPFGTNKIAGFGVANFNNVSCTDPVVAQTFGVSGTVEFADHLFYSLCDYAPAGTLCGFDGTAFSLINTWVYPPSLPDGTYFTDLTGAISKTCIAPSSVCVPLSIESNPPRGWAGYNFSETQWPNGKVPGTMRDFNTSPTGKQWVTAYATHSH